MLHGTDEIALADFETIKELVALGTGVSWLPDFLAQTASGNIVPAVPGWRARFVGQVHFLYANPKHPSTNVKAFVSMTMELLQKIS